MSNRLTKLVLRKLRLFIVGGALPRVLLLLLLVTVPCVTSEAASGGETIKRVLLVSSDDSNLPPAAIIEQSFRSAIKRGSPVGVDVYSEYLDADRTRVADYEQQFIAMLQRKYVNLKPDIVIAIESDALRMLLRNRTVIFQDTPIVFMAIDKRSLSGLALGPNVTGVWGEINLRPNLELALNLQPDTKHVVVVGGVSEFDKFWLDKAREDFRSFEGKLEFTYLIGLTIPAYQKALANLPQNTVVSFLSVTRDNSGANHINLDVLRQIAPASSVPIYGTTDLQLGSGIVGGKLISFEAMGTQTGQLGLRVLAGEKPDALAPYGIPSVAMFDWREIRRWGINEQMLPTGSIIRFKELSIWELHKWQIVAVISLAVFEALLIVGLLLSRSRRRRAELERERFAQLAQAEHKQLEEVIANVPGSVWESIVEPGTSIRKSSFISQNAVKMLGYSVEEWLSTPGFGMQIIHEEDRERVAAETDAIMQNRKEGVLQFRAIRKDGEVVWQEAHESPILDEDDKPIGLRGVTIDITERKLAEESLRQSEGKNSAILRAIPDLMFLQTHNGDYLDYHAADERDLLVSPMEFMGKNMRDVLPLELSEQLFNCFRCTDESGEAQIIEYELAINGDARWFEARIVRTSDNKMLSVVRDITVRKQAEVDLKGALDEVSELKNQLQAENFYLREEIKLAHNFDEIVGQSDSIKYVLYKIEQVAPTNSTVLITGETGTGKELVARAIHNTSLRKNRPLVRVNCAALSAGLIESELFGHEKGSFTGAIARKIGRFELANGATIFLDEIGELPIDLQVKLLRVLQEGEFERLGSSKTVKADVRIIAATNRNLAIEVQKGNFREDLWYRLNVFPITVPPLKQRVDDIPFLVEHFVRKFSTTLGKKISSISPAKLRKLMDYSWPGNIRELANVIERAVINTQGAVLHLSDQLEEPRFDGTLTSTRTLEEIEREHIVRTLSHNGWRIEGPSGAARSLGLNPSTLRTRMTKLGIQKPNQTSV